MELTQIDDLFPVILISIVAIGVLFVFVRRYLKLKDSYADTAFQKKFRKAIQKHNKHDISLVEHIKISIGVRYIIRQYLKSVAIDGKSNVTFDVDDIPFYNSAWNEIYNSKAPLSIKVKFSSNPSGFVTVNYY